MAAEKQFVEKIVEISRHRNGICGEPFYVVLFKHKGRLMIASLFDDVGYCAVYSVDELKKKNIKFGGGNSWRGDEFESELRATIKMIESAQK